MSALNPFMGGCCFMGFLLCGLFFLRFWQKSRDRLFLAFALAFAFFALERVVILFLPLDSERQPDVYLLRLAAFCIIILGIIGKNRR